MTTQNLGGQKMEWQRGVSKSRNCDCNNFTVSGRECKKVVLPKCAALANDRAKANHTGSHGLLNYFKKRVCPQWLLMETLSLQYCCLYLSHDQIQPAGSPSQ